MLDLVEALMTYVSAMPDSGVTLRARSLTGSFTMASTEHADHDQVQASPNKGQSEPGMQYRYMLVRSLMERRKSAAARFKRVTGEDWDI
jgi:hypothetical protein